jgi:hypothetical protein
VCKNQAETGNFSLRIRSFLKTESFVTTRFPHTDPHKTYGRFFSKTRKHTMAENGTTCRYTGSISGKDKPLVKKKLSNKTSTSSLFAHYA